MLVVESLTHAFGRTRVLTGVFLRVNRSEVVGVVGRNGCGKTTMLRAVAGTLDPDQINVRIADRPVVRAFRSGLVCLLPQEPWLPRRMRVNRIVALALPDAADRAAVLDDPRIGPLAGRRAADLSGGERRYLEVMLAASFPAEFCLLDEPFTEIEPIYRPRLIETIRRLATATGRGFIVTDHAYRDVLDAADRLMVMVDGELHAAQGGDDLRRLGYTP